jgi:hypothetical protein
MSEPPSMAQLPDIYRGFRKAAAGARGPADTLQMMLLFARAVRTRLTTLPTGGAVTDSAFSLFYDGLSGTLNALSARIAEVSDRAGVSPVAPLHSSSRLLLHLSADERRLPAGFVNNLSNIGHGRLSSLARATRGVLALSLANEMITRCQLPDHQLYALGTSCYYPICAVNPAVTIVMPNALKKVLATFQPMLVRSPSASEFVAAHAGSRIPVVIDLNYGIGVHEGATLRMLVEAERERSAVRIDQAIYDTRTVLAFFSSPFVKPLPCNDVYVLSRDLNFRSIEASARAGTIIADSIDWSLFDSSQAAIYRYFIRLPTIPNYFIKDLTVEAFESYMTAPLTFSLAHSRERRSSDSLRFLRLSIDSLATFRAQLALDAKLASVLGPAYSYGARVTRDVVDAIPLAAATGTAYYLVLKQFGLHEPLTHAAIEALVALIVNGIYRHSVR